MTTEEILNAYSPQLVKSMVSDAEQLVDELAKIQVSMYRAPRRNASISMVYSEMINANSVHFMFYSLFLSYCSTDCSYAAWAKWVRHWLNDKERNQRFSQIAEIFISDNQTKIK